MKMIKALPDSPDKIHDISIIANALYTLKTLERDQGVEYVFVRIQEKHAAGGCFPAPIGWEPSGDCQILGKYDKKYFEDRKEEERM